MTRPAQLIGDEAEMFSIEREVLQPFIRAVSHNDDRLCAARVDPDSMGAIELSCFLALSSPGANVIELRVVLLLALVGAAFARIAQNPDAFSVERSLRHQVPLRISKIQKLVAAFLLQQHAAGAGRREG